MNETYDFLLSISSEFIVGGDNCEYECELLNLNNTIDKNAKFQLTESYIFSNQKYHFYKITLNSHQKYKYQCTLLKTTSTNINIKTKNNTNNSPSLSGEIIFPKNNTSKSSTKLAVFGDWSQCENGKETLNYLINNKNKYDATLFLGDLAYDLNEQNGVKGNNFMEFIRPFTSSVPFMITSGNHETNNNYEDYTKRFNMPSKRESNNLYYSFDINDSHYVSIASDFVFDKINSTVNSMNTLLTWLQNDLKKSDKKWKVVYMHRPLYCSDNKKHCGEEAEKLREIFEEIFKIYKVDLVLAGHVHTYERLYPLYKGKVSESRISEDKDVYNNPSDPVYMVCGSAGNPEKSESKCKFNIKYDVYYIILLLFYCDD